MSTQSPISASIYPGNLCFAAVYGQARLASIGPKDPFSAPANFAYKRMLHWDERNIGANTNEGVQFAVERRRVFGASEQEVL